VIDIPWRAGRSLHAWSFLGERPHWTVRGAHRPGGLFLWPAQRP